MASVNKVILIGNLGKDPEVRYTGSGQAVATFSLATNDQWTDKQGQKQTRTEWHRIVAWGKLGELCGQYLQKGRSAYIEGRLQTREWTDKENKKNYSTEIVASQVTFLGQPGEGKPQGAGKPSQPANDEMGPPPAAFDDAGRGNPGPGDDDIPF